MKYRPTVAAIKMVIFGVRFRMYHCAAPSTVYSWIFALNDFQHECCFK